MKLRITTIKLSLTLLCMGAIGAWANSHDSANDLLDRVLTKNHGDMKSTQSDLQDRVDQERPFVILHREPKDRNLQSIARSPGFVPIPPKGKANAHHVGMISKGPTRFTYDNCEVIAPSFTMRRDTYLNQVVPVPVFNFTVLKFNCGTVCEESLESGPRLKGGFIELTEEQVMGDYALGRAKARLTWLDHSYVYFADGTIGLSIGQLETIVTPEGTTESQRVDDFFILRKLNKELVVTTPTGQIVRARVVETNDQKIPVMMTYYLEDPKTGTLTLQTFQRLYDKRDENSEIADPGYLGWRERELKEQLALRHRFELHQEALTMTTK